MFDIFYISTLEKTSNLNWMKFKSQYPVAKYSNSFRDAQKKSLTKFFWVVWDDLIVNDDFKFDYVPDEWSENYVHVFLNNNSFDGICLVPKKANITDKEISYRFFVNKKQIDIQISKPKPYDVFEIDSYDEYEYALKNTTTEMFWMSSKNIEVDIPDVYFAHSNIYDRNQNHAFINQINNQQLFNGLFLCSKNKILTKKEVEYRHLVDRKEWDIVASKPKPYDIVFISYQEINAEENYSRLLEKFPNAKRIHGVKGIHRAHIEAAKLCKTEMFWVVDGDAYLLDDFKFNYWVNQWDREQVHVWRSQNPINGLIYGYGGVKLLPRQLTLEMDVSKPDMTTSISNKFVVIEETSNITVFNTDPFNAWKSAFRECAKLSSGIIDRQNDYETNHRLNMWTTVGKDKPFGKYAILGANEGRNFGLFAGNKINLINDFDWLKEQFKKSTGLD